MPWIFGILLLMPLSGLAAPLLQKALEPVRVLERADFESPILFIIPTGGTFWLIDTQDEFARIKVKRAGQWVAGFVKSEDLNGVPTPDSEPPREKRWAVLIGGSLSHLQQGGKSFVTDDQVEYKLTGYTSQTIWPSLSLQFRRINFWRLSISPRATYYRGQAVTDVGGNSHQPVTMRDQMIDLTLERALSLYGGFYVSAAIDFARASSLLIEYNGRPLSTSNQDYPNYLGLAISAGGEWFWGDLAFFAAVRGVGFLNQSPIIYGVEPNAGLGYFF